MDHLDLFRPNAASSTALRCNGSSPIEVSPTPGQSKSSNHNKNAARGVRDVLSQSVKLLNQLAARRLIFPSASELSFLSVVFSSSSVFCRRLAQSLWPSCRAHAIRLP